MRWINGKSLVDMHFCASWKLPDSELGLIALALMLGPALVVLLALSRFSCVPRSASLFFEHERARARRAFGEQRFPKYQLQIRAKSGREFWPFFENCWKSPLIKML